MAEPEKKKCVGCGRNLRDRGTPREYKTPVEYLPGICDHCYRYGPEKLPTDLALWAVEQVRKERYLEMQAVRHRTLQSQ